jgi:hypothetical protein
MTKSPTNALLQGDVQLLFVCTDEETEAWIAYIFDCRGSQVPVILGCLY